MSHWLSNHFISNSDTCFCSGIYHFYIINQTVPWLSSLKSPQPCQVYISNNNWHFIPFYVESGSEAPPQVPHFIFQCSSYSQKIYQAVQTLSARLFVLNYQAIVGFLERWTLFVPQTHSEFLEITQMAFVRSVNQMYYFLKCVKKIFLNLTNTVYSVRTWEINGSPKNAKVIPNVNNLFLAYISPLRYIQRASKE